MAKTPYEIRLDILSMARDNVHQRYHERVLSLRDGEQHPAFPSAQDIITEAEQLKKFIDSQ